MIGPKYLLPAVIVLAVLIAALAVYRAGFTSAEHETEIDNANAATDAAIAALGRSECRRLDGVHWDFWASECVRDTDSGGD